MIHRIRNPNVQKEEEEYLPYLRMKQRKGRGGKTILQQCSPETRQDGEDTHTSQNAAQSNDFLVSLNSDLGFESYPN